MQSGEFAWWELDVPTQKLKLSDEKVKMLGYDPKEFGAIFDYKRYLEVVHANDRERVYNAMRDHVDGKSEFFEVEYRVKTQNGAWKWFKNRGKVVKKDQNGISLLVRGVVYDISKLKENDLRLRSLLSSLEDNVTLVSKEGIILESWSREKQPIIIKKTVEELINKNFKDFLPKELVLKFELAIESVVKTKKKC